MANNDTLLAVSAVSDFGGISVEISFLFGGVDRVPSFHVHIIQGFLQYPLHDDVNNLPSCGSFFSRNGYETVMHGLNWERNIFFFFFFDLN